MQNIYHENPPRFFEFHGMWGSLAVTQQYYKGFLPFENEQHLMVVVGGPVLYFRDNDFLVGDDSYVATESIYNRWQVDGDIQWDEDLSGPFTILLINKLTGKVTTVADLMSFIPVYTCQKNNSLYLGTHVDALAEAADEVGNFDQVSLADFVLNDVVTYPYTVYKNLRQSPPASLVTYTKKAQESVECYWVPTEENLYRNVKEAAAALRSGIQGYVDRVTEQMTDIAQFISAGEDSRALSGLLPKTIKRDAYIFLDHMNREGKIAKKVASIYGANFHAGFRNKTHYLDILPEASKLIGAGHQYTHAHSLGFDKQYTIAKYNAVFGGYLSDSLLKAAYTRKARGTGRFPFLPQFQLSGESRSKAVKNTLINKSILAEITRRRCEHLKQTLEDRRLTAHEWFVLRPASMRVAIPNLYSTRRLFKSYEPFMCKEAVKISAAVPTSWKLNRRLFNTAMKPYLKPSKWLLHADGRLPYFSWWVNMPIQFTIWFYRHLAKRLGLIKGNQGPWGDWQVIFKDTAWQKTVDSYSQYARQLEFLNKGVAVQEILVSKDLNKSQKINLLQVLQALKDHAHVSSPNMKWVHVPKPRMGLREHKFDGQHYWEINKAGYPQSLILDEFQKQTNKKLQRTYRVNENPYHRFFVWGE